MKIIDINGRTREASKVFPDPTYPGFVRVEYRRHHEWYTIQEFIRFNPELADIVSGAPKTPQDEVGSVTSAGKDFLRDSSKNFDPNAFMGFYCWISRGQGEGQKRSVIKNTHNQIVVDKPWDTKPNKTSQYVLSHNVKDVRSMGNTLPVEDIKDFERKAIKLDRQRGKVNQDYKYLSDKEANKV